jgi:IclR family transcriptional regulator, KDG regulon repressor
MRDRSIIQSIERAGIILDLFTTKKPELSLNEISQEANLNKTTAFRFCGSLEKIGFLEKVHNQGGTRYRLGVRLFHLGSIVINSLDLQSRAKPYLNKISEITGDNAFLIIEKDYQTYCIDIVKGQHFIIDITIELGEKLHLTEGGAPLAIFANMEANRKLEAIKRMNLTENEAELTLSRLKSIKRDGYAYYVFNNDIYPNAASVGSPILNHEGIAIGALSVGGIEERFSEDRRPMVIDVVKKAAMNLSKEFGWIN